MGECFKRNGTARHFTRPLSARRALNLFYSSRTGRNNLSVSSGGDGRLILTSGALQDEAAATSGAVSTYGPVKAALYIQYGTLAKCPAR